MMSLPRIFINTGGGGAIKTSKSLCLFQLPMALKNEVTRTKMGTATMFTTTRNINMHKEKARTKMETATLNMEGSNQNMALIIRPWTCVSEAYHGAHTCDGALRVPMFATRRESVNTRLTRYKKKISNTVLSRAMYGITS